MFKYWKYILNTLKSVSKYIWFGKGTQIWLIGFSPDIVEENEHSLFRFRFPFALLPFSLSFSLRMVLVFLWLTKSWKYFTGNVTLQLLRHLNIRPICSPIGHMKPTVIVWSLHEVFQLVLRLETFVTYIHKICRQLGHWPLIYSSS